MGVLYDSENNCKSIDRNRGFRPSDCNDSNKKQILLELSSKIWQKTNVRKNYNMNSSWIDEIRLNNKLKFKPVYVRYCNVY